MKKAKKLVVLLMVAAMACAFCACGGSEESADDSTPITEDEIAELYTSPDDFTGRTFEFTARVLDVEKTGSDLYIQAYQDIKNYENNTIVVCPDATVSPKTDEFIKVKGTVDGQFKGENYYGTDIYTPQITAQNIEIVEGVDAFPAKKTIEVDKTVKKGDYKATVTKVDYTADETRVYVKVENSGNVTFENYPDQGVIVQNGKQFETEWNEYYPEPSTDLKPGASSESVIAFEKVEESDFTFSFNGYDDESYDEVEFSFDISVK